MFFSSAGVFFSSAVGKVSEYPRQRAQQVSRHKINELLNERHQRFTPLQRLLRQATSLEQWTAQLRAILPESLARDCQVSDVRRDVIVVSCRNASAATKLRFMAPEILEKLTDLAAFQEARDLKVQVSRGP